jgi:thiamine kinase-like enzyme
MQSEQTLQHAEKLLSDKFGKPIHLQSHPALESENVVLRCDVTGGDGLHSVIVKQMKLEGVEAKRQEWLTKRFMNEWATLQFLKSLPHQYTARWIAGDADAKLLIVEDLGAYPSVQDVLLAKDTVVAEQALMAYAAALGQFQAATVGREHEFKAMQSALGAVTPWCDGNYNTLETLPILLDCFQTLHITPEANFEAELREVAAAIHESQLFRALCHCDAGMHNVLWMGDGEVRLLDFEFATYQHALTDIVCARMAYPPAYHGYPVPPTLVTQLENVYRAELAHGIPAANDDKLFYDGVVQTCAQWMFSELAGLWRAYFKQSFEQGDTDTKIPPKRMAALRSKLIVYLRAFVGVAGEFDRMPAVRWTLERVIETLLSHWESVEPMPYFPAFVEA